MASTLSTTGHQQKRGEGYRSIAVSLNFSQIFLATEIFASNINSSTRLFVSSNSFVCTSTGSEVSLSVWTLTSGLARLRAPASILRARSLLERDNRVRI